MKRCLRDREFMLSWLLLCSSCGAAGVFATMWFQDTVKLCEPNLLIRGLELLVALTMTGYAFYCLLSRFGKFLKG